MAWRWLAWVRESDLGPIKENAMKIKPKLKTGAIVANHNLRVKSGVKSGSLTHNHNVSVRRS
jgi:hypothetical protein